VTVRRATSLAACAACAACFCAGLATPALAATSASIQPSFQPYRLGASAAATISLRFSGGVDQVPAPLSGMVLRLPAGLGIDLTGVATCQASRLRSAGPAGCPAAARIGRGHALLKVHAGSQTLPEEATISVFRGPNRGGHPTFEIFGHGETPLDESTISTAVLQRDTRPFGWKLIVSVPPIPTLVYEPNASFSSLSLTIGAPAGRSRSPVAIPRRCPRGGFPFASSFTFADRSSASASASARLPCPVATNR
jgi:hypothetical protein